MSRQRWPQLLELLLPCVNVSFSFLGVLHVYCIALLARTASRCQRAYISPRESEGVCFTGVGLCILKKH